MKKVVVVVILMFLFVIGCIEGQKIEWEVVSSEDPQYKKIYSFHNFKVKTRKDGRGVQVVIAKPPSEKNIETVDIENFGNYIIITRNLILKGENKGNYKDWV